MPRLVREEEKLIEPLLLKVREAARMLNVSERHIDNLAADGKLEKIHLGDAVRITRASVNKAAAAADCQSAFKFDPVSASNFDPFERRVLAVALASSELAGVAETWRARAA